MVRCRDGDLRHTNQYIRKQLGDGDVPTSTPFDTLSLPLSATLLKQVAVRGPTNNLATVDGHTLYRVAAGAFGSPGAAPH